jgi:hypothetical protein
MQNLCVASHQGAITPPSWLSHEPLRSVASAEKPLAANCRRHFAILLVLPAWCVDCRHRCLDRVLLLCCVCSFSLTYAFVHLTSTIFVNGVGKRKSHHDMDSSAINQLLSQITEAQRERRHVEDMIAELNSALARAESEEARTRLQSQLDLAASRLQRVEADRAELRWIRMMMEQQQQQPPQGMLGTGCLFDMMPQFFVVFASLSMLVCG